MTRLGATRQQIRRLSRKALHEKLKALVGDERFVEVEFLKHLDEMDRVRGWADFDDCTSLWAYCTKVLGLCEGAAYRRIEAMQLMRRYPQTEDMLRDGRLCMTTLGVLKPVLEERNATLLFSQAAKKSKKEVERLVAEMSAPLAPQQEIRALGVTVAAVSPAVAEARPRDVERALTEPAASLAAVMVEKVNEELRLVSSTQVLVKFTGPREIEELVEWLRDRLGPALKDGTDVADVILYCLREVQRRLMKRDGEPMAAPPAPAKQTAPARAYVMDKPDRDSHHAGTSLVSGLTDRITISRDLDRAVRKRDNYCCSWRGKNGRVCGSRRCLEIDHIVPVALGGKTELANLRLLCREHNQQAARETFGDAFVERKIAERRKSGPKQAALPLAEVVARARPSPTGGGSGEDPPG